MNTYEDLLRHVLENGATKTDRTGTGTISTFGAQLRFDLEAGFPLITTKRVFMRGIAEELFWFLRGETNARSLQAKGVHIWDEWADENGDLGPLGYSAGWRAWYAPSDRIIEVPVRTDLDRDYAPEPRSIHPSIDCDLNSSYAWAIDSWMEGRNRVYRVQFRSGAITEITRPNWRAMIQRGTIKTRDPLLPTVAGVGYLGEGRFDPSTRIYALWYNMIRRCYDKRDPGYRYYGARGVTVSPIWHDYSMFRMTIGRVPGFHRWLSGERMELDKDYYASSVYAPSTTIFTESRHNKEITIDGSCVRVGGTLYTTFRDWAAREQGIQDYACSRWRSGKPYRGIPASEVERVAPREGFVWRREIYIDQIAQVLDQIRNTPDSRRMVVSAWNVAELDNMALPPCHMMFQFYVADGKLSCQLYQRSADLFLGVPFNIASYALLTHMVAQQTGLEVGEFIWTGGDCHIYTNHLDQVHEQLGRRPYPFPELRLRKAEDLFSYTWDDIEIVGYQHHPAIKAPVAV